MSAPEDMVSLPFNQVEVEYTSQNPDTELGAGLAGNDPGFTAPESGASPGLLGNDPGFSAPQSGAGTGLLGNDPGFSPPAPTPVPIPYPNVDLPPAPSDGGMFDNLGQFIKTGNDEAALGGDVNGIGQILADPTQILTDPAGVLNTFGKTATDTISTVGDISAQGGLPSLVGDSGVPSPAAAAWSSANLPSDVNNLGDDAQGISGIVADPTQILTDPSAVFDTFGKAGGDVANTVGDLINPAPTDLGSMFSGLGGATQPASGLVSGATSDLTAPVATSPVTEPPAGYLEGEPEGGSGSISTTVYPDGSSVSSSTEGGVTTVTTEGPGGVPSDGPDEASLGGMDGIDGGIDGGLEGGADAAEDGVADGLTDAGDAASAGGDSIVGDILGSGVPLAAVGGAAYDLAEGDYDGAIAEGVIGGADIAGEALGLPGFDGDVGVVTDLIDGNTGALEGDAETAAIETGASIAGGAIGSIIGPEGTIVGAAIGNFVGGAIAPSVENAVSDTVNNAEDFGSDTVNAISDAGSDLSDGNVVGAVGDLATGAVDDLGDVASEAVDLTGDALEGVGDVVTATAGLVSDVGDGIEDVADGAEDVADDIGDGIEDLGDDIADLF